jgi:hypothetical protein
MILLFLVLFGDRFPSLFLRCVGVFNVKVFSYSLFACCVISDTLWLIVFVVWNFCLFIFPRSF